MVNKFLYPKGGAETYMFKLGEYLQSLGNQVEYFGMEHPERCVKNSADVYTDCIDFRNANITQRLSYSLKTIYSSEAAKKIKAVIECFNPDIVHLNNINFQLTPSIIYEIKKHNIPIVQTVHDVQIACPNHRMYIEHQERICTECIDGKYINCAKNKCIHSSALKSVLASAESYYYHKRDTYNLIDGYICPSSFIADKTTLSGIVRVSA
ncbi:MAG: glycosyltransferase, partial [Eubacterium sp.]